MKWLRRLLGALVLLLSAVGFVACIAGLIGVWIVRQKAAERVQEVSPRLDVALGRASAASEKVGLALEKAREEVARVSKESASRRGGDEKGRLQADLARRIIRQEAGPKINEGEGRLAVLADAAVAASSLLEGLQDFPLTETDRVKPEQVQDLADQAARLSAASRKLLALAGPDDTAGQKELVAAAGEVELALQRCQAAVDGLRADLDRAREELPAAEARLLAWMLFAAVAATVVCAWVAVSQVSLFAHALKWCRGA